MVHIRVEQPELEYINLCVVVRETDKISVSLLGSLLLPLKMFKAGNSIPPLDVKILLSPPRVAN